MFQIRAVIWKFYVEQFLLKSAPFEMKHKKQDIFAKTIVLCWLRRVSEGLILPENTVY